MNNEFVKEYFKFQHRSVALKEAIIQGSKYRITLLTSRLIRFEYSEDGQFEDRPSQTFWFRKQIVPKYQKKIENNRLTIETEHLIINYNIEEIYTNKSLSVLIKETNKTWHYGDLESHNLKGTARTLDGINGSIPLEKGILSRDGFATFDDAKALVFDENYWLTPRDKPNIDLYFFGHGHDYLAALNDFYNTSGKTPMIPRYILGNWWSRYWAYTEESLSEIIENFEKHQIPMSVCIIDMDWHIVDVDKKYIKNPQEARWSYGWTGYTWNENLFPNPKRMLDYLHNKNLKVSLNLHPADGIRAHEFCYEKTADFMNVNKAALDPVLFDIADPKFVSAYFDFAHHPHEEMGVDFWWLDWQQGSSSNLQNLDPLWMLNHLHFYDSGRNKEVRPFTFSRFASHGNQRYPIGFSGDTVVSWESLNFQPYFTTTASNIGYGWWSHDIGGHMGGIENGELFTRWVQFGVFSPIFRLHSTKNVFSRREPWRYDQNVLKIVSKYMRLRHQLIPYIYTMAYENFHNNIPLIRPLYYYDSENNDAYKYRNEYYFGSQLLVAPITEPVNTTTNKYLHKVYLPEGGYFDFFNKEYFEGGIIHNLYDLESMPVFAKAGAIIPISEENNKNGTDIPQNLSVEIFPLASNEFTLFEDDGISQNYLDGDFNLTTFKLEWDTNVNFTIKKANKKQYVKNRTYKLIFNCFDNIKDINIDGDKTINYDSEFQNNTLIIRIYNDDFNNLSINLGKVSVSKKDLRIEKIFSMLEDAKFDSWRKQDIYNILIQNINVNDKIKQIMNVENVPSDVVVSLIHMLG